MKDQIIIVTQGRLTRLDLPAGAWLEVLQGEVWLTEAGVAEDFVLGSGATYCVQLGGHLLLDAAAEARLRTCLQEVSGPLARAAEPQMA